MITPVKTSNIFYIQFFLEYLFVQLYGGYRFPTLGLCFEFRLHHCVKFSRN